MCVYKCVESLLLLTTLHEDQFIHSFINHIRSLLFWWLEPFPAAIGREAGYTVDRPPVLHRTNAEMNEMNKHACSHSLLQSTQNQLT